MPPFMEHNSDNHSSPKHMAARYARVFERLFGSGIGPLRQRGLTQRLDGTGLRSLVWRVYLHVLPLSDRGAWRQITLEQRANYSRIKQLYKDHTDIYDPSIDSCINNPLSEDQQSPWNRMFKHKTLRSYLVQDVDRVMPENEFFRSEYIRAIMVDILFVFAVKHPEVHYVQGMHEVLAVIMHLLTVEYSALNAVTSTHADPADDRAVLDLLKFLFDADYMEQDSFYILEKVLLMMDFCQESSGPTWTERHFPSAARVFRSNRARSKYLLWQGTTCNRAYLNILPRFDRALFLRINMLETEPQVFGLRMFRVLFGREFSLADVLVVWDALFSDSYSTLSMQLVPALFIAVLICHRQHVLSAGDMDALALLIHLPALKDVRGCIQVALHVQHPEVYRRPLKYQPTNGERIMSPLLAGLHKLQQTAINKQRRRLDTSRRPRSVTHPIRSFSQAASFEHLVDMETEQDMVGGGVLLGDVRRMRERHRKIARLDSDLTDTDDVDYSAAAAAVCDQMERCVEELGDGLDCMDQQLTSVATSSQPASALDKTALRREVLNNKRLVREMSGCLSYLSRCVVDCDDETDERRRHLSAGDQQSRSAGSSPHRSGGGFTCAPFWPHEDRSSVDVSSSWSRRSATGSCPSPAGCWPPEQLPTAVWRSADSVTTAAVAVSAVEEAADVLVSPAFDTLAVDMSNLGLGDSDQSG